MKDPLGKPLFETIAITLVCDDCLKSDHPELCTHKMAEMPRWLSSSKMEVVKSLLSEDPVRSLPTHTIPRTIPLTLARQQTRAGDAST